MTKESEHRVGKKDESVKKLRRVKVFRVPVDDIVLPEGREWPDPLKLHGLVQSMVDIGLVTPIIVQHTNGALVLVDGLARLEAARALHWKTINCEIVAADRSSSQTMLATFLALCARDRARLTDVTHPIPP